MKLAARFMSSLLIASLLLPSLLAAPVAATSGVADPTTSQITASPTSVSADVGSATITVALFDDGPAPLVLGGDTVTLGTDLGSIGLVTDIGDGTYTATLTATTAGTATITGTVNGPAITDTATVTITPGALDHIVISPSLATKVADVGQAYTAEGFDQFDNSTGDETGSTTFTIGGSGSSCLVDVCKSTAAGAHTVTGDDGGKQDTANLTVVAADADHLSVGGFTDPTTAGVPHNVTVTARDTFGNLDTNYTGTVHITSSDPGATLPSNHVYTLGDGGSHAFSVTLNTQGVRTITATDTVTGTITGVQGSIDVNAGAAEHFAVTGFADPTVAGVAHTFTVTAQDVGNNTDTTYSGTVTFTSSDGAATLPVDYTFVGGDNGTHTFTLGATLQTSGPQSITATDGGITGTQNGITVTADVATTLVVSGFTSPTISGAGHSVTVEAQDQFGNPATGYTGIVHFTSNDGLATLPGDYTFVGGDAGSHTFAGVILRTVGSRSITATDTITPSITGTQSPITVNPGAATHFTVTGYASPTIAGASHNFTVTALDASNNTATGYTGTVQFTSSDGSASLPSDYVFVGGDAGVRVFSASFATVGTQTIVATDTVTGTITGTQSGIVVNPGAATHFDVSGFNNPTTAGVSDNFTVTALDVFDNTATGYAGTVQFTSDDGAATVPGDSTLTLGTGTFSATLRTSGTRSITATDTVTGTITGTQSGIVVNAATATTLIVSGFTSPTISGAAHSVTVEARDQFGNTATGYTGTVHFTSTDPSPTLPGDYTFVGGDAGSHTFGSVVLRTVGSRSITATDTVTGTITGTQSGIVVNPGAATHFAVTGYTSPATAGVSDAFTVTALDAANNTATGYTGTVHFTSSDGAAVLPSNYVFVGGDAGVRVFSATFHTAGTQTIVATDTITPSITGTQTGIVVNGGAATHFDVSGFTSPTTSGVAHTVTVTALDAFDNTATGYTGTVAITSSDGAATLPVDHTYTGGDAGVFGFSVTLNTVGTRSITATDTGNGTITGTQVGIVVNPAAATHLTVTGYTDPTVSGAAHSVTVTALDAQNNIATGYTGIVHFTSTDGLASLPSNYTFTGLDAGTHNFSGVILRVVGDQTITVTDTITGTINGAQSLITVTPGAATHYAVTGFTSPGTAGVSDAFTVTALDAAENVATGYAGTVHFTSTDGAATLPINSTLTLGTGVFAATFRTAGTQSLTATDTLVAVTGTQSGIVIGPAAATHYSVTGFNDPATAGAADSFIVTALDAFENVATGYTGEVHFTSNDGLATLPGDYTFTVGDAGDRVFSATLRTAGSRTITATDTVTGTITGGQTVVVDADIATHFTVTGFNDPTVAGISDGFTVTALDVFDNIATGYAGTVHFTSSDGLATLPANSTLTSGVGAFLGTLRTAGTQSITATDTVSSGINGTQVNIDVTAAAANHLAVSGYPGSTVAGVPHNVTVTALDPFDNTDTAFAGLVTVTALGGTTHVTPSVATALGSGTGTFSVTFDTVGTLRSISATSGGVTTGSQTGITVTPSTATHFTVTGFNDPITAGVADDLVVTALDAFNNTATGYTGTVHLTSTDSQAVLTADHAYTGGELGVHTFVGSVLKTAGSQSITATDTGNGTINGTQSAIDVLPAAADHLTVTGYPSPTVAGDSHAFTVTALDPFDNTATGYLGTITFTSSDTFSPVLPVDFTFLVGDAGAHLFNATFHQAGTRSLTATDTGTGTITGTQPGIVVSPADAVLFTVTAFTSPSVAGTTDGFDVVAFDLFDNQATGYTGTMHFTSSDPQATLPIDSTMTNGDGSFSATLRTAGTQSITATDTVSSSTTGTQSGIVVTPATTDHFLVTGYPSPTMSAVAHNVTVTAHDAFDNLTPTYTGTVQITSSDVGAILPADNTLTLGVGTFSVTLNTAGNQSITATDSVTLSITGSQVGIAIDPGPVAYIVLSPSTASILATDTQLYLAEGFDAGNNDLGDFTSVTDFSIVGGICDIPVALGPNNRCSAVTVGDHTVTGHQLTDDVSDTATLTILDTDPVALDDTPADIFEDAPTTFDVLANDSDINLDVLTITGATDGALGTVVVNVTGLDLTYTPDPDANGSDTFTYDISDGNGGTHTATVHVTITPVNDAPTYTVGANQAILEQSGVAPQTVAGWATLMSPGPADEATQVLSFTISNNASTLFAVQPSVNVTTGNLTYTPAVNRNGVAIVTLTLHDNGGLLNGGLDATAHTFTITVTGPNHAPFAINDAYGVVAGSPATALPVLANDNAANPDVGEILHITNVTQGIHGGKVTITGGGTGLTYKPKSGYVGTDFFTYRIHDGALYSSYATVLVNVPKDTYKPVATAPVQSISSQAIGTSTVKIHLSWTGTDRGYGIAKFEVYQSTDGHSYKKIRTTSSHSMTVTLTVNHTYRFRVRAIDKKNNIGSYKYGPTFKVVRYQESSAVYSAPWVALSGSPYSGGHARATTTNGQTATISRTGRTFAWVGVRGPTRGTASVYVDGVLKANVNLASSSTLYKWVIYSITLPTSAFHSFRIVYTGPSTKRIDLDAFIVLR